jgi:hypothetical protein
MTNPFCNFLANRSYMLKDSFLDAKNRIECAKQKKSDECDVSKKHHLTGHRVSKNPPNLPVDQNARKLKLSRTHQELNKKGFDALHPKIRLQEFRQ